MFETASNLTEENSLKSNDSINDDNSSESQLILSDIDFQDKSQLICRLKQNKTNRGSIFILTFDYTNESATVKWLSNKMKNIKPQFHPHILDAIFKKFKNYNHGEIGKRLKCIIGFTEIRIKSPDSNTDKNIIRCCPSYRSEKDWYDWIQAEWKDYGTLEGQCLMFLDFNLKQMETYDITNTNDESLLYPHPVIGTNECVLIHSIQYNESGNHYKRKCNRKSSTDIIEANFIKNRLCKFVDMEKTYHIVPVDCIKDTAYVIPYSYDNKEEIYLPGCPTSVIVMKKFNCWNKLFVDYDDKDLIKESLRRVDETIPEDDERYAFES